MLHTGVAIGGQFAGYFVRAACHDVQVVPAHRFRGVVLDADPGGERAGDLGIVATNGGAVLLQHLVFVLEDIQRRDIGAPPIGVLGDEAEQLLFAHPTNHQRDRLVRSRRGVGVVNRVVFALEGSGAVAPQRLDDRDCLFQLCDSFAGWEELVAVFVMFAGVVARTHAQDEATLGEQVHIGGQLRQIGRVAERLPADHCAVA